MLSSGNAAALSVVITVKFFINIAKKGENSAKDNFWFSSSSKFSEIFLEQVFLENEADCVQ